MFNFLKRKKKKEKKSNTPLLESSEFKNSDDNKNKEDGGLEIPLPICIPYSCPSCEKSSLKIDSIGHELKDGDHISVLSMSCIHGCDHKFNSWFRSNFNEPAIESELRKQIDELKLTISDLNDKINSLEKENMSLFSENRDLAEEKSKSFAISETLKEIIKNKEKEIDEIKSEILTMKNKNLKDQKNIEDENTESTQAEIIKENNKNKNPHKDTEIKDDVHGVIKEDDELQDVIDMPEIKLSDMIIKKQDN